VSTLHALLIGIDDYFPDRLPDGSRYPSLQGATRDVDRMEILLRDQEKLKPENTRKLLSRTGEDGGPAEPPDRRPTYTNIVAALKRLTVEAKPGDRVYIHYSGHGARMPTEYPGAKGLVRYDEALVPCDIGDPGSRYLRDVELFVLLRLLADRGLHLTVVLDCCHAGGVMRSRPPVGAEPRRVRWVSQRSVPSAVLDPRTLVETWQKRPYDPRAPRGLRLQSLLPADRWVLFAACRPNEIAYEYPFENGEPQGALTYWLLDILKGPGRALPCGEIHRRLLAHIYGTFAYQTPMLHGDQNRGFLAGGTRAPQKAAAPGEGPMVLRIGDDGRVLIDIGTVSGAQPGEKVLLPGGVGEIEQPGATASWVKPLGIVKGILKGLTKGGTTSVMKGRPEPGIRVEVLGHRASIRLVPPPSEDAAARRALDRLAAALWSRRGGSSLELCDENGAADLGVTVGASGIYEILDPEGVPFPNLGPLRIDIPGMEQRLIHRLGHLARFRKILTTDNLRPPEWLRIGLELCGDDPDSVPEPLPPRGVVLGCGEVRTIRIVNQSRIRLDVAALDLAPDYSVTQLLPRQRSRNLVPLDPGQGEEIRLEGWLPKGWQEGTDVLKVFATQGAASFRWLELPALGHAPSAYRTGLTPSAFPEEEWITTQVEIQVRR
jgi:hypothetical protein